MSATELLHEANRELHLCIEANNRLRARLTSAEKVIEKCYWHIGHEEWCPAVIDRGLDCHCGAQEPLDMITEWLKG